MAVQVLLSQLCTWGSLWKKFQTERRSVAQRPQRSSGNVVGNLLSPREGFQGEVYHVFARCVEDRNKSLNYPSDKMHHGCGGTCLLCRQVPTLNLRELSLRTFSVWDHFPPQLHHLVLHHTLEQRGKKERTKGTRYFKVKETLEHNHTKPRKP